MPPERAAVQRHEKSVAKSLLICGSRQCPRTKSKMTALDARFHGHGRGGAGDLPRVLQPAGGAGTSALPRVKAALAFNNDHFQLF